MVFEMFGVADFQNVSIASRKDLIARLPLRLRPANMNLSLYQFSVSLNGFRQQDVFLIKARMKFDIANSKHGL